MAEITLVRIYVCLLAIKTCDVSTDACRLFGFGSTKGASAPRARARACYMYSTLSILAHASCAPCLLVVVRCCLASCRCLSIPLLLRILSAPLAARGGGWNSLAHILYGKEQEARPQA
eukprot:5352293-Prymnesium_polylepis.1